MKVETMFGDGVRGDGSRLHNLNMNQRLTEAGSSGLDRMGGFGEQKGAYYSRAPSLNDQSGSSRG